MVYHISVYKKEERTVATIISLEVFHPKIFTRVLVIFEQQYLSGPIFFTGLQVIKTMKIQRSH